MNPLAMQLFTQLTQTDVTVRRHFMAWQMGDFGSFEAMLLQLCIALSEEKERLKAEVLRVHQYSTAPIKIPTGGRE